MLKQAAERLPTTALQSNKVVITITMETQSGTYKSLGDCCLQNSITFSAQHHRRRKSLFQNRKPMRSSDDQAKKKFNQASKKSNVHGPTLFTHSKVFSPTSYCINNWKYQ